LDYGRTFRIGKGEKEEFFMKRLAVLLLILTMIFSIQSLAVATNGDNLIGVGPISRAMGGVGIAYPLDSISAVFANPAAMCFGPYCPASDVDFAGTLFMPDVKAEIRLPGATFKANSDDEAYAIPAIGLSIPITKSLPFWRFGLSAYGVSGLGVDYRDSSLDQPTFYPSPPLPGPAPLITGEYTQLQKMKFAPAIAFQPNNQWSFGLAGHINYSTLDLRDGSEPGYSFGAQLGVIYKPIDQLSLGVSYVSPQETDFDRVADFDPPSGLDRLTLESPQTLGFGAAYTLLNNKVILEGDVKWINWGDAKGYEDFGWDDQWVFAFGVQVQPIYGLFLRAGYNYAKSPVNTNNGFVGSSMTKVQGKSLPQYYYETFRIIGFPAIVEQHLTFGVGYEFTQSFGVHLGYMHAFEETIKESGTDLFGQPVTIQSTLSEDAVDFGLIWRF
jgi:long-chain fatty acid transport protein